MDKFKRKYAIIVLLCVVAMFVWGVALVRNLNRLADAYCEVEPHAAVTREHSVRAIYCQVSEREKARSACG